MKGLLIPTFYIMKCRRVAGGELAQWESTRPLIQRSPVRFRAWSHTGVMDYGEACFMHLTPGVVHNFQRLWVYRISVLYAQKDPRFLLEKRRGQPREFWSLVSKIDGSTLPQVGVEELLCGTPSTW